MGGASGAPRLLTINFILKISSNIIEKNKYETFLCKKIYKKVSYSESLGVFFAPYL